MECHEGATMIKTFRGMIADGGQDTIVLHTNNGSTGYKIVKLQVISNQPTTASAESVVKVYKVEQSTIDYFVDFSDNTLLGVALWSTNASAESNPEDTTVIFDQEVFNQDIYITHDTTTGSEPCNYYLELEQVKLDLSESTVATLKDIRNEKRIAPA
jgi:uncharacterized protein (UPF0179 family)